MMLSLNVGLKRRRLEIDCEQKKQCDDTNKQKNLFLLVLSNITSTCKLPQKRKEDDDEEKSIIPKEGEEEEEKKTITASNIVPANTNHDDKDAKSPQNHNQISWSVCDLK